MKVANTSKIMAYPYVPLRFPEDYAKFYGGLPADSQWKMLIHGGSFSGKSSHTLDFANVLTRFGNVLYGNFEESTRGGSIQNKLRTMKIRSDNISFLEPNTWENFIEQLQTGKFTYAIIDSLSVVGDSRSSVLEKFSVYKNYPNVSFIYLLHADKTEKTYIGPSALKHNTDAVTEIIDGIAYSRKNRFKLKHNFAFKQFDIHKKIVLNNNLRKNSDEKKIIGNRQGFIKSKR